MAYNPDRSKIHHWSLGYALLKPVVGLFFRLYYRKVEIRNKELIPYDQPVIFGANHQNSLMDALAILYAVKGQPVFLARADIFKKETIAKILHFLNIMPVFRMRDGMENLQQNDDIFHATQQVLHDKYRMCLMPEGNHADKRRLRQLVKGIFRIAFMAQHEHGERPMVKIIPVGIDYSDYYKYHQALFINFGPPIEVADFHEHWKTNPAVAINELRSRLADEMRKLMIDIRSEEYYDAFMALRTICNERIRKRLQMKRMSLSDRFIADKEMIRCLDQFQVENPEGMKSLAAKVDDYSLGVKKLNMRDWVFRRKHRSLVSILIEAMLQIVTFPVFAYGFIFNILPYYLPVYFASKLKDPQFISSIRMVSGMIIFILYYLILLILAFIFLPGWWALAFLVSAPLAGSYALRYYFWIKKLWAKTRYVFGTLRKDPQILHLQQSRQEIVEEVDSLIVKYGKSLTN
jgi:1-acyl-sn-glycerol-3-phosphate acyltransferase